MNFVLQESLYNFILHFMMLNFKSSVCAIIQDDQNFPNVKRIQLLDLLSHVLQHILHLGMNIIILFEDFSHQICQDHPISLGRSVTILQKLVIRNNLLKNTYVHIFVCMCRNDVHR